jgi:hypothetical protein
VDVGASSEYQADNFLAVQHTKGRAQNEKKKLEPPKESILPLLKQDPSHPHRPH